MLEQTNKESKGISPLKKLSPDLSQKQKEFMLQWFEVDLLCVWTY